MKNLGAAHENLDHKAYTILKNMIMDRKLLPGEKIHQEKLAQDLGISRTPLIGALKYLEQEKLVVAQPRRGFFVRLFDKQEMVSIFELREVLEGLAARRAAVHITETQTKKLGGFFKQFRDTADITDFKAYAREDRLFHSFVTETGSKEFLKSILQIYNIISFSYQHISAEGLVQPPNETIHDHMNMIEAISRRDPDRSEDLMRRHFRKSIEILRENFEEEN